MGVCSKRFQRNYKVLWYIVGSQGFHDLGVIEVDEGMYLTYRRMTYELEDAEETDA